MFPCEGEAERGSGRVRRVRIWQGDAFHDMKCPSLSQTTSSALRFVFTNIYSCGFYFLLESLQNCCLAAEGTLYCEGAFYGLHTTPAFNTDIIL